MGRKTSLKGWGAFERKGTDREGGEGRENNRCKISEERVSRACARNEGQC